MKIFLFIAAVLTSHVAASAQYAPVNEANHIEAQADSLLKKKHALWLQPGFSRTGVTIGAGYRHSNTGISAHFSNSGAESLPAYTDRQVPFSLSSHKRFTTFSGALNLYAFLPLGATGFTLSGSLGLGFSRVYDFTYFKNSDIHYLNFNEFVLRPNYGVGIHTALLELLEVGAVWHKENGLQGSFGLRF